MTSGTVALMVLVAVLMDTLAGVAVYIYYGRLILRSRAIGAPVGFGRMVRMTLAGVNANALVTAYLKARQAGTDISLDELEAAVREHGNLKKALDLVGGAKANITGPGR